MDDELPSPSRLPMPASSSQIPKKDASKRRSLLLPPGSISGAARKGLLSLAEEEPVKQRPMSMIAPTRNLRSMTRDKLEEEDEGDEASPESRDRAREEAHAALMGGTKPPQPRSIAPKSSIARTTSMRAPGLSRIGGMRAQDSNQTSNGAKETSTLKDKASRPGSAASTASRGAAEGPASRLRAPASTVRSASGLKRSATTTTNTARHSRAQSALHPPSSSAAPPRTDVRRHPTISEGSDARLHRPAFSTLQQHYSPKKNLAPKPASSTLIHSQPIDTGSSLGLETQLLQTRLLQLSILHRQAEPTLQAWSASAKRKLKHKFTDVAAECEVVRQKEKDWRRRNNSAALKEWCKGDFGLLAENISTLSNIVEEVMQLVEDGGRVHQALEIFEAWITWVEAIYSNRDQQNRAQHEFIEGLGDGWRSEVAALVRKLSGLARQLDALGKAEEGSSLSEILSGFKALSTGSINELKAVEVLESEVVQKERRWIDEQIQGLDREVEALLA